MASGTFTPYSTGAELFGARPNWIGDTLDQERILSYQTYEQIYWGVPDIFKVSIRGSNALPIYVPTARTIIDTTLRYVAPDFGLRISDSATGEATVDVTAATMFVRDFMKRERFRSKFTGFKRYGLIRGDGIWHLTADDTKPIGYRLSLTALDPGMYFPITDPEDVDRVIGCHLVEYLTTPDGPRVRRLTYRKVPRADGFSTITVEEGLFEVDKWGQPDATAQVVISPPVALPEQITSLPVYHVKNFEEPGNPFGSSEIRGLERIMSAVNQVVSDESLALALAGIGVYATDASQPVDPRTQQPMPWRFSPGSVIHHDGTSFNRVQGVGSVTPYGDHYNRLWSALKSAAAVPDVAIGNVDVSVAQSGVALALQLGPMLSKANEKNDLLSDVHANLFFDILNMWLPAYEQTTFDRLSVDCVMGDAVPIDRAARLTELNDMLDRGVIDTAYYRTEATKLGYEFPDDIGTKADTEFAARNQDQFAARLNDETDDGES